MECRDCQCYVINPTEQEIATRQCEECWAEDERRDRMKDEGS